MGRLHAALRKAEGTRSGATPAVAAQPAPAAPASSAPQTVGAQVPVYVPSALRGEVDPHLVVLAAHDSEVAGQYRTLRDNLVAAAGSAAWKVFAVTSSVAREGRSVTAANLACAFAERTDRKVVLIDADMREPGQHRLFALDNQRGLSDYLAGGSMLEMALQRSRLSNLWVLPAGRTPANPAELLQGKRMDDLLARLRRDYDVIVVDSPAMGAAPDAAVLAPRTDATLLVVRMGATRRDEVKKAVTVLREARVNVVGTVLTAAPALA
jgi:capsular exopolysaccharide synthesis family protein